MNEYDNSTELTVIYKFPAPLEGLDYIYSETFQMPAYDLAFLNLPPVLAALVLSSFAVHMSAKTMPHTQSIIGLNYIDVLAIFSPGNPGSISILNPEEGPYKIWI